ncbi:MAG: hypothetical protein KGL39_18720 [Patescibacteria group bacterium]|nr:hypothetical protein [Patescibacteria group bacterium]
MRVLIYTILCVALAVVSVKAEETPPISTDAACQAELQFNKQDFIRMRDQFVKVAITADALKKKLDEVQKQLDELKPKPTASEGKP